MCGKDVCADSDCLVPSDTIWGQGGLFIPDLSAQPSGLAGKERPTCLVRGSAGVFGFANPPSHPPSPATPLRGCLPGLLCSDL